MRLNRILALTLVTLFVCLSIDAALDKYINNSVWRTVKAQNFQTFPIDSNRLNAPGCTQLLPGVTGQQIRINNGLLNVSVAGTGQTVNLIFLSSSTAATGGNYAACSSTNGIPTSTGLGTGGGITSVTLTTGGGSAFVQIPIGPGGPAVIGPPGSSLNLVLPTSAQVGGYLQLLQQ